MICNKIIDNTHIFTPDNSYIVDTNVLISLYGTVNLVSNNTNKKILTAQTNFNKALSCNAKIYVPAIVISEFINRCIRDCHTSEKNRLKLNYYEYDYKKDYRVSEQYEKDMSYIISILKNDVFTKLKYISDSFETVNLDTFFKFDDDDFNDKLIINIANKNNLFVISADKDITSIKIK